MCNVTLQKDSTFLRATSAWSWDVVNFLCSVADNVIRWPSFVEVENNETAFKEMANFPGVLGAIDGCHIQILAPDYCQHDYVDRNHNHTVNLMAVCDASKKFTYCFAGYPGSVHDQRVLGNSVRTIDRFLLAGLFSKCTISHYWWFCLPVASTYNGAI